MNEDLRRPDVSHAVRWNEPGFRDARPLEAHADRLRKIRRSRRSARRCCLLDRRPMRERRRRVGILLELELLFLLVVRFPRYGRNDGRRQTLAGHHVVDGDGDSSLKRDGNPDDFFRAGLRRVRGRLGDGGRRKARRDLDGIARVAGVDQDADAGDSALLVRGQLEPRAERRAVGALGIERADPERDRSGVVDEIDEVPGHDGMQGASDGPLELARRLDRRRHVAGRLLDRHGLPETVRIVAVREVHGLELVVHSIFRCRESRRADQAEAAVDGGSDWLEIEHPRARNPMGSLDEARRIEFESQAADWIGRLVGRHPVREPGGLGSDTIRGINPVSVGGRQPVRPTEDRNNGRGRAQRRGAQGRGSRRRHGSPPARSREMFDHIPESRHRFLRF